MSLRRPSSICHGARHRIALVRWGACTGRLASTQSTGSITSLTSGIKYLEITDGIEQRKRQTLAAQRWREPSLRTDTALHDIDRISYSVFCSTVGAGDLVASLHHGPVVIVQDNTTDVASSKTKTRTGEGDKKRHAPALGEEYLKDYIVCNASGTLIGLNRKDVLMRLAPLVSPAFLPHSLIQVSVDGVQTMMMKNLLRRVVVSRIRSFIVDSDASWDQAVRVLDLLISKVRGEETVNLSLFQLAQEVDRSLRAGYGRPQRVGNNLSEFETAAVSILSAEFPPKLLEGDATGDTVSVDSLYLVYRALTAVFASSVLLHTDGLGLVVSILGHRSPESVTEALHQNEHNKGRFTGDALSLISRYALKDLNFNDVTSESAAVSLLRSREEFKNQDVDDLSALSMLESQGMLDKEIGPFIHKHQYHFLQAAAQTAPSFSTGDRIYDRMASIREDLGSDVPVYCIDNDNAHEVDDGISVRRVDGKVIIGVHIADPVSCFQQLNDQELLSFAYKQTSTAYFPTRSFPMLSNEFSKHLSLDARNKTSRCLTISFSVDEETGNYVEGSLQLRPQSLSNVVNMTYDEADNRLSHGAPLTTAVRDTALYSDLSLLSRVTSRLEQQRSQAGATTIELVSPNVKVIKTDNNRFEVDVALNKGQSPAQRLVAECMITANRLMAAFTKEHGIPNIYRSQPHPRKDGRRSAGGVFNQLSEMSRSALSPVAGRHNSLGVSEYCQATSPLRRFQDIVSHWQIHTFLLAARDPTASKAMLTNHQLYPISLRLQTVQGLIKRAERKSIKYWVLRKFEELASTGQLKDGIRCTVSDWAAPTAPLQRVFLDDWGIFARLDVKSARSFDVGQRVTCSISKINSNAVILELTPS